MATNLQIHVPRIQIEAASLESGQALNRIASGSALLFVGTFLGLGLNYGYAVVLARVLGAEQFGLYAIGLGCFNLLSVIAVAGHDTAVLRYIPALRSRTDAAGILRVLRAALVLSFVLGTVFAAALLLGSDFIASRYFHNDEASTVLKWFSTAIPFLVISTVAMAALQAFREVRWRTAVKYTVEPVLKFAITLVLLWAGWELMAALVALPIALALTALLALVPLRHVWLKPGEQPDSKSDYHEIATYSLPLLGGLIVNGIATRSDVLLLGYWATVDQIGIYSAAFQTAAILAVVLGTLESIATPFLSESISRNDQEHARSLAGALLRWTVIITFPLCMLITVFAEDILSLFGRPFEAGAFCLIFLTLGQFANCVTGCSNGLLLWAGRSKLVMWNNVVTSVVQIGLYLHLIPAYGINGAAIGASACLILSAVMRIAQVHHVLNIWPYDSTVVKPLIAGLISLGLILAIRVVLPAHESVVLAAVFAMAYASLLIMLGLHDGDRATLIHLRQRFTQFG